MPLKLANVLDSFQGYIDKTLYKKLDLFVIIYFDNIFVHSDKKIHVFPV